MRYYVTARVDFAGHIEAESEEEAEQKAWTAWGDTMDNDLTYDGVYSIDVEEDEDESNIFADEEEDE